MDAGTEGADIPASPSRSLLESLRWTYFSIVLLVFALGCFNIWFFLVKKQKWRTFPLLLMYICGQFTLIFALARNGYREQPAIDPDFDYQVYSYFASLA